MSSLTRAAKAIVHLEKQGQLDSALRPGRNPGGDVSLSAKQILFTFPGISPMSLADAPRTAKGGLAYPPPSALLGAACRDRALPGPQRGGLAWSWVPGATEAPDSRIEAIEATEMEESPQGLLVLSKTSPGRLLLSWTHPAQLEEPVATPRPAGFPSGAQPCPLAVPASATRPG